MINLLIILGGVTVLFAVCAIAIVALMLASRHAHREDADHVRRIATETLGDRHE